MTFIGLVRLAEGGHGRLPGKTMAPNPYGGVRDPTEVIQGGVWRHDGFSLSLLDVALIRTARGIVISDETIRVWGLCFGGLLANALKRKRPQAGDQWYLDEGFVRSQGKRHDLWCALDQDGNVPDILLLSRRSAKAAKRFFRKRMKDLQSVPRAIVTDRLRRYAAAKREVMPGRRHDRHHATYVCRGVCDGPEGFRFDARGGGDPSHRARVDVHVSCHADDPQSKSQTCQPRCHRVHVPGC
jgi:transposase-like protein